jgi:LysR family positive regulator for ilvC
VAFIAPKDLSLLGEEAPSDAARFRARHLESVPLVVPIGGLERERLDQWLERQGIVPRVVAEVRGNEGIIAMVSLGSGVGLVPELVLSNSPLIEGIRVLERIPAPSGYQVSLCARPRNLKRRVVEAFWNLAREVVSTNPR